MEKKKDKYDKFIQSLKALFDYHITEDFFKKPDEVAFRELLLFLFQKLSIETRHFNSINHESGSNLRAMRCRIVAITNSILTAAQAPVKLCYMDLVNPSSGILLKVFRHLICYLGFVQATFNSLSQCHDKILQRNQLLTQKNHLRKKIEESKIYDEQNLKQIKETEKKIPEQHAKIHTLVERENRLKKDILSIQQEMEACNMNVEELKAQATRFRENIVNDAEANSILTSREQINSLLAEQEEFITAGRQTLSENSASIEKIQTITNKMEQIIVTGNLNFTELGQMKEKFDTLEVSANEHIDSINKCSVEIINTKRNLKQKKENVAKLLLQKNEAETTYSNLTRANSNVLRQKLSIVKELSMQEDVLSNAKIAVKDELDLLYTISSNVIKQMSESIHNQKN